MGISARRVVRLIEPSGGELSMPGWCSGATGAARRVGWCDCYASDARSAAQRAAVESRRRRRPV